MVTTGRARIIRQGHRGFITPIRSRRSVVTRKSCVSLGEALGGKPYFWLGGLAEEHNLSSAAALTATPVPSAGGDDVWRLLVEALADARTDCEFLLSVIDSCDEAEAPSDEIARIRASLTSIRAPLTSTSTVAVEGDEVERVARAICSADGDHWFGSDDFAKYNERWRTYARAAIDALTGKGGGK